MSNPVYKSIKEQLPGLTYKGATGHVFRLIHVSHADHLAWCPAKHWTQFRNGKVYTYDEAVKLTIEGLSMPDEGRWYAIGQLLYSVE